jgi:hypothetical protein
MLMNLHLLPRHLVADPTADAAGGGDRCSASISTSSRSVSRKAVVEVDVPDSLPA